MLSLWQGDLYSSIKFLLQSFRLWNRAINNLLRLIHVNSEIESSSKEDNVFLSNGEEARKDVVPVPNGVFDKGEKKKNLGINEGLVHELVWRMYNVSHHAGHTFIPDDLDRSIECSPYIVLSHRTVLHPRIAEIC
jgi:hypothetical protein